METMLKLVMGGQRVRAAGSEMDAQSTQLMMSGPSRRAGDDVEPTTLRYRGRTDELTRIRPKPEADEQTVIRPQGVNTTSSPALAAVPVAPLPPPLVAVAAPGPAVALVGAFPPPVLVAAASAPAPAAASPSQAKRGTFAWGAAGFTAVVLAALAGIFVARGVGSSTPSPVEMSHAAAATSIPAVEEAPVVDPLVAATVEPGVQPAAKPLPVVYRAPARAAAPPAVVVAPATSPATAPAATPTATGPVATSQPGPETTSPEPAASFTPPPTASTPDGNDVKKLSEEADKELINLLERTR